MKTVPAIGERIEELLDGSPQATDAVELLQLGEEILQHWVLAKGLEPTRELREGFRLLALHRQGARGDPSFNACRETCRELVYHYNLITQQPEDSNTSKNIMMMTLVANHLYLFISGKMEVQQLGDFCCASKPLRSNDSVIESSSAGSR